MSARRREPLAAEGGTPASADEAAAVVERDALRRALATLPPDHALAVHLRLVEGYPFADVARVMGRSVGACQMLVLRAGRELRGRSSGRGSMRRGDETLARRLADALDGARPADRRAARRSCGCSRRPRPRPASRSTRTRPSARSRRRQAPIVRRSRRPGSAWRRPPPCVVAAAAALILAWPFGGPATRDVQAQALAALGGQRFGARGDRAGRARPGRRVRGVDAHGLDRPLPRPGPLDAADGRREDGGRDVDPAARSPATTRRPVAR